MVAFDVDVTQPCRSVGCQDRAETTTGKLEAIPDALFCFTGFECDSVSSCNNASKSMRQCVATGQGKTGSTAQGFLKYLENHRPPVFGIENVPRLAAKDVDTASSNLEDMVARCNTWGYYTVDFMLDAASCGLPQRRPRIYVLGMLIADRAIKQSEMATPSWVEKVRKTVASLKLEPVPLGRVLFRSEDPRVVAARRCLEEHGEPKKKRRRKNVQSTDGEGEPVQLFEVDHNEIFTQNGLSYPPMLTKAFLEKTVGLTQRQREVLYFDEQVYGEAADLTQLRVRDLHNSLAWGSSREGICPCLVSSAIIWARGPCTFPDGTTECMDRLLSGQELLMFQGFDEGLQNRCQTEISHNELVDIAGNHFGKAPVGALHEPLRSA